ncbi:hypothetical protein NEOLEDRAFT_1182567 [Neolentinus lepideus HHB14362 ss-1]|uniref:Protein kinase domain-containing protein n=1 Tax=Neolentinus lepideus HHB14362 ss-1 TaxID=1314782 RepID=A0A165P0K8_9AGAM|nr:hypothetical protein NEOLEDRAFT_1182567 [Neolentinus lepideus HHB14362 ss-1]
MASHCQHVVMVDDQFLSTRHTPDSRYASPTAIANARRQWAQTRDNPLNDVPVYGHNPYRSLWKGYKRSDPRIHSLAGPSEPIPELKELRVRCSELTWLENLGGDFDGAHNSCVYKVLYRGRAYVLKVYRQSSRPDDEWANGLDGPSRFENERKAYANLLHFGVCDDGYAPRCLGWFTLHVDHNAKWLSPFFNDSAPPNALLLEFLPESEQLNVRNISCEVAQNAMHALARCHTAGVLHRDINPRNHLVLPGGKAVIIDFDTALSWPDKRVSRLEMKWESESAWNLYFQLMLPDKLIGLDTSQTAY